MTAKAPPLTAAQREAIRAASERVLSPSEAAAYLGAVLTPEQEADALSLIAWFKRRYRTPGERLAYARRAFKRWTAGQG